MEKPISRAMEMGAPSRQPYRDSPHSIRQTTGGIFIAIANADGETPSSPPISEYLAIPILGGELYGPPHVRLFSHAPGDGFPIGFSSGGMCFGVAEMATYPISSKTTSTVFGETSEVPERASESGAQFRISAKVWIVDMVFLGPPPPAAARLVDGVWFPYFHSARFLISV